MKNKIIEALKEKIETATDKELEEALKFVEEQIKTKGKFPKEFGQEENPSFFFQVWGHGLEIICEQESILIGKSDGLRFKILKKAMEETERL